MSLRRRPADFSTSAIRAYAALLDAFRAVDRPIADQEFPVRFQFAGCYMIDMCSYPVDQLDP